jgi:hypothetical protein
MFNLGAGELLVILALVAIVVGVIAVGVRIGTRTSRDLED